MKTQRTVVTGILACGALLLVGPSQSQAQQERVLDNFASSAGLGNWYGYDTPVYAAGVADPYNGNAGSVYFECDWHGGNNQGSGANLCTAYICYNGGNPWISAGTIDFSQYAAIQFDVKWDTTSTLTIDQFNTGTNWPASFLPVWVPSNYLATVGEWVPGMDLTICVPPNTPDIDFGSFNIPTNANTGWRTVTVPIPSSVASSITAANGIILKKWSGYSWVVQAYASGKFWLDNVVLLAHVPLITWTNPYPIVYGTPLGSTQLNAVADVAGNFTYTPSNGTVLNAGTNILTAVFTPSNVISFTSATNSVTLVVNPAPLTAAASNASMVYGGTVPALTIGYSGFINGDTITALTTLPTISTAGTSLSAPGTYPITVSGGVASNYTFVYANGTLTITPAPLTITANNMNKSYGQTLAFAGMEFTSSGLQNGETVGGVALSSAGALATGPVSGSPYAILCSNATGGTFSAGNYAISYVNGSLGVNPASLTITANNANKYCGQTLTFAGTEFTSSGLQNGETVGRVALSSAGALATAPVSGSPYAILCSNATGGTFNSGNYSITYANGWLTVNPVGPAPYIAQISPSVGPTNGGATVTILGTAFESGAAVDFGSSAAALVTFVSSNELTALTPAASSGIVNVEVLNPDGNTVTATNAYAFGASPAIIPVTNQTINVGQALLFTNGALAVTLPVSFVLDSSAPQGASMTTNGIFNWQPSCVEGSTTNQITIWAIDSSSSPLSNSMTFTVVVGDCAQIALGSTVVQTGQSGCLPVSLFSTAGLTNLTFTVTYPTSFLTNLTIAATNPIVGTATAQWLDPADTLFNLAAANDQWFEETNSIGSICLSALQGPSAFVPLTATNIIATRADGTVVASTYGLPGRVVVVDALPLLGAGILPDSTVTITLYGNPGSNYVIQSATSLDPPISWQPAFTITLTNLSQAIALGIGTNLPPLQFFRAYQCTSP